MFAALMSYSTSTSCQRRQDFVELAKGIVFAACTSGFQLKTVLTGRFSRRRRAQGLFHLLFCRFNIQLLQNRLAFYDVHQGFFRHHLSGIQLKIIVYKALFLLRSVLDNYLACSRFEGGCFLLRRTKCLVDSFYIALVLPVQQQTHANTELRSSQYSFA